jgi:hypothetical protein
MSNHIGKPFPSGNSQKDYANAEKYVILTRLYNAITI